MPEPVESYGPGWVVVAASAHTEAPTPPSTPTPPSPPPQPAVTYTSGSVSIKAATP